MPPFKDGVQTTQERIYSTDQLVAALKSSIKGLEDQLQVLTILDGTACSWPGVTTALSDLQSLVTKSAKHLSGLDAQLLDTQQQLHSSSEQLTLTSSELQSCKESKRDLQGELGSARKENKQLSSQLKSLQAEHDGVKGQLWELEKQRAEQAERIEMMTEDAEQATAEIQRLQGLHDVDTNSITVLKETLAGRNADVQHLTRQVKEQALTIAQVQAQLVATQQQLQQSNKQRESAYTTCMEHEKRIISLEHDNSRLAEELARSTKEVSRLTDIHSAFKRVEAEKLREAQHAHDISRAHAQQAALAHQEQVKAFQQDLQRHREEMAAKQTELTNMSRQVTLLQLNTKDMSKQIDDAKAQHEALQQQLAAEQATVKDLQKQIEEGKLVIAEMQREHTVREGGVKEAGMQKAADLHSRLEEFRGQLQLARAMGETYQRDIKELQGQLAASSSKHAGLVTQLEAQRREGEAKVLELVKMGAGAEAKLRELQASLDAKDAELKRERGTASARILQLEKTIERLQREVDASAAEIDRLHSSKLPLPGQQLPPILPGGASPAAAPPPKMMLPSAVSHPGVSLFQEDLAKLRRMIQEGRNADALAVPLRNAVPRHTTR